MTRAGQVAISLTVVVAAALFAETALHHALAQTPFGAPRAAPQAGGMIGWLLARQAEFYREISTAIRAAKSDGSAVWTLLAISFAYGVFHAAGPGHGKAVIASYLVANEETARRGVVLSFASALLQALVAVLVVGIGAWLLNVTSRTMCGAERAIEIASYALIAAFGARLVWSKGGGFVRALQAERARRWHSPRIITTTVPFTCMTRIAGIRMDRCRSSSQARAAGSAGLAPSSR